MSRYAENPKILIQEAVNGFVVELQQPYRDRVAGDPPTPADEIYVFDSLDKLIDFITLFYDN